MLSSQGYDICRGLLGTATKRRRLGWSSGPEQLEVRKLLTNLAWTDSTNLTISFAPDGTNVAGNANELYAELQHLGSPQKWQSTVISAFQTWLNELGYTITVVNDSGAGFGIAGSTYNDPRFGDIRVAAVPLTSEVLASAIPKSTLISGTWAGDMMLNSAIELTSLDELYALSLHEAGHILGLEHSTDPKSPMFDHGGTTVLLPTAKDKELLQSLYGLAGSTSHKGEREDDSNGEVAEAEEIELVQPQGISPRFQVSGSIQNASDVDTYLFRPRNATSEDELITTIILRTTTTHLIPKLDLLDAEGEPVEFSIVANGNGLLILQSRELEAEEDYVVQVQSAVSDSEWSKGDYELTVTFSEREQTIEQLARGSFGGDRLRRTWQLQSAKSQLVNFMLDTRESEKSLHPAVVAISVFDGRNHLVFRTVTVPGSIASGETVLLGTQNYNVVVEVLTVGKGRAPEVDYLIQAAILSTDAGPLPNNPIGDPAVVPTGPIVYTSPQNIRTIPPLVMKPPKTAKPPATARPPATVNLPVTTAGAAGPVLPKPTLTWPGLIMTYPWITAQ